MSPDVRDESPQEESARERTMLAEERTFSAWVRTGLTSLAAGLGVVRLLMPMQPTWLLELVGVVLVLLGGAAFGLGMWSYRKALRELKAERVQRIPMWLLAAYTSALLLATVCALALIALN